MLDRPVIVFDVNETVLDLETLRPTFDRIFDDPAVIRLGFANLIAYAEALTVAAVYVPFTDIGAAVLRILAARRISISEADSAELPDGFASMPPTLRFPPLWADASRHHDAPRSHDPSAPCAAIARVNRELAAAGDRSTVRNVR
jgi:hypothetical protein